MLALPDKGMHRSVNVHNTDLGVLCDWIEASVLFDEEQLSKSDVIDILMEEQIYAEQGFATERVDDAWDVISRRSTYLSAPLGITVSGNRITRTSAWNEFSAYGFCLALSCTELYSGIRAQWGGSYVEQGALFEALAGEALSKTFSGWTVKRIGWSAEDNTVRLRDALPEMLADLCELEAAEAELHLTTEVKDLGLDLVAFYSFGDRQASMPVMLVQCASGENWVSKRHTPDIEFWARKIISFNSRPVRGFVMPYSFTSSSDFRRESASVQGVFFDRYRLLRPFSVAGHSVSAELNAQLIDWVTPRIAQLPRDEE